MGFGGTGMADLFEGIDEAALGIFERLVPARLASAMLNLRNRPGYVASTPAFLRRSSRCGAFIDDLAAALNDLGLFERLH
jgi:hypothetical protein